MIVPIVLVVGVAAYATRGKWLGPLVGAFSRAPKATPSAETRENAIAEVEDLVAPVADAAIDVVDDVAELVGKPRRRKRKAQP